MSKYQFIGNIGLYNFKDKEKSVNDYTDYMLCRTNRMFKYENMPSTIDTKILELMLQTYGHVGFTKVNDEYYVFEGNFGGEPDVYYMPKKYIITNPALNLSKECTRDEDIVIIPNNTMYKSLLPLFRRYFSAIVETDLSLRIANISSRMISLISASDDKTMKSAKKYIENIEKGELDVIGESAMLDGVKTSPYAQQQTNNFTSLIETRNYWLAELYEEIGLNKLNNMKRESLNDDEINSSDDILVSLVNDMIECRKEAIQKINELYGLDIVVKFNSSWFDTFIENEIKHLQMIETLNSTDETEETDNIEEVEEPKEEPTEEVVEETNDEQVEETSEIDETIEEIKEELVEDILEEITEEEVEDDGEDNAETDE